MAHMTPEEFLEKENYGDEEWISTGAALRILKEYHDYTLEHRVTELESKIEYLLKLIHDNLGIVVTEKPISEGDLPF